MVRQEQVEHREQVVVMVVQERQEVTVQMVLQEQVDYQVHFLTIKQKTIQQVVTLVQDLSFGIT